MNNIKGAKWWKFDFHTHTPASDDFLQGCSENDKQTVTPEFWLQKFIDKGIDCVAITDHNSGAWIDKLKIANEKLAKPLHLFPGVEISVSGSVHLLAIFDPTKTTADIDSLLGAVGYNGTKGNSDSQTTKILTKVIDIIVEKGGIAIPAHADKEKGLFALQGNTLGGVLNNTNIHAMELCDENYLKPQLYKDKKINWTEVLGSDTHNFRSEKFGNFTWIKMDNPCIEGLKLALIDGKASVKRDMNTNPNQHAEYIIESLEVKNAKYIGKDESLKSEFSPFLNTIIGGRGSSKSTLLEFMRFVMRRDKDASYQAVKDDKYFSVNQDNLLTNTSQLSLVYKKGSTRYRLNWSADASLSSLQVDNNGQWQIEEGEIKSLFPVHIYSQKQIFELSKKPEALLDIIDKDKTVDFSTFEQQKTQLTHQYKQIEQQITQAKEKITQKTKLTGELNDLARQIKEIEQSGHKQVLQNYRKRQRQLALIKRIEQEWQATTNSLEEMATTITPSDFDDAMFEGQNEILQALQQSNNKWQDIHNQVTKVSENAKKITQDWQQEKQQSQWLKETAGEISQYEQIKTQLEQQNINPEKYPLLLQQQTQKQYDLKQIKNYEIKLADFKDQKTKIFTKIKTNRKHLTKNRQKFLTEVLKDNQEINIQIEPFKENITTIEQKIRSILQCGSRFDKDINFLISTYEQDNDLKKIKQYIINIYSGENSAQDNRFYNHLRELTKESLIDFELWFPQDNLKITFGSKKDAIKQGSPGQKCAALLAFILSYGDTPLLLDQPEDDLDNELIYQLIVKQIRATKHKRQIIIVTHNANIVVNGDAEMVLPMSVTNGQSYIEQSASIQNQAIRDKICNILEGGQKAFSQRYKRIHLEK